MGDTTNRLRGSDLPKWIITLIQKLPSS